MSIGRIVFTKQVSRALSLDASREILYTYQINIKKKINKKEYNNKQLLVQESEFACVKKPVSFPQGMLASKYFYSLFKYGAVGNQSMKFPILAAWVYGWI